MKYYENSIFAAPMTLCYAKPMTDINRQSWRKLSGAKLNPDEQRKFLGTFEERVLVSCSIDKQTLLSFVVTGRSTQQNCRRISACPSQNFTRSGVYNQIFYLKISKDLSCEANNCFW